MMFRLAVVIVSVAYTAAQAISSDCISAFTKVGTDPGASKCLALEAFVPVITAAGSNSSLISSLNTWLGSMCGSPSCNNDTLAAIASDITSGCSAELTSWGLPSDAPTLTKDLEAAYPIFRNVACLRNGNTPCIIELATAVEAAQGVPLTLSDIIGLYFTPPPPEATASIVCTNCNKEVFNLLSQVLSSNMKAALKSQCGASFVDGSHPSGITESANPAVVTGS